MNNIMQEHPKITSVAVIVGAVAVVIFLYFLSTQKPSRSPSSAPVFAHGKSGPVAASESVDSATSPTDVEQGIREVDFQLLLSDENVLAGSAVESVIYLDVDGNGMEEAAVLWRGKGESRPLNWRLYGMRSGEAQLLYERTNVAQGELMAQGPRLVESEGVYGEADPPCCPSSVKKAYYVWKADGLVVLKVELAPPAS